jgi:hypothetical protein
LTAFFYAIVTENVTGTTVLYRPKILEAMFLPLLDGNSQLAVMKAASSSEIKSVLKSKTQLELTELCLRLARFKKENKELLTYLLFESDDLGVYLNQVKEEMEEEFRTINKSQLYLAKKSLRRILRQTNKYIRYTGSKTAELELLIHFCRQLKDSGIALRKSNALENLYQSQLKKINTALGTLHEDLQYDYSRQIENL